uniref:Uncharacterized protein n=1 Tax=Wuchereria bancrofti TaxID=6293 RepID=A0AAF5PG90_WUCBA
MQACARTSESKAIHFIRSHLGIMRFGKRNEAQFDSTRVDKRIDLNYTINDYSNSYVKVSSFDYIN